MDKYELTPEEQEIEDSLSEEYILNAPSDPELEDMLQRAAANYLKKNKRINIRVSDSDLMMLKRRAAREGLPYQTMIASVLHKYATGMLEDRSK